MGNLVNQYKEIYKRNSQLFSKFSFTCQKLSNGTKQMPIITHNQHLKLQIACDRVFT